MRFLRSLCVYSGLLIAASVGAVPLAADEPTMMELAIYPQQIDAGPTDHRFLPPDDQLKPGNAAVVILRSIWEQQAFMTRTLPRVRDWMEMPIDDDDIKQNFSFGSIEPQLRRAAWMRDADWDYPMNEEPAMSILLPDVQGLRMIVGYCQTLWIRQRLAAGDLDGAREAIQVQFACGRHLSKTPFLVTQMVGSVVAGHGLDETQSLIQKPASDNLYWTLAMLPDSLSDWSAMIDRESTMLRDSLPSLANSMPPIDDPAWSKLAGEMSDLMLQQMVRPLTIMEGLQLQAKMFDLAKEDLRRWDMFTEEVLLKMRPEEVGMRWILTLNDRIWSDVRRACTLPPNHALKRLKEVDAMVENVTRRTGTPASPFPKDTVAIYLAMHRFDRRVKLLQTVEAIRDDASRYNGELPVSLEQLYLPAPNDPLTQQPFVYERNGDTATLSMARLEDVAEPTQQRLVYRISVLQSSLSDDSKSP